MVSRPNITYSLTHSLLTSLSFVIFQRRDDIMYECMTSLVLEQLELHCKIARLEIIKVLVSENEGMLCLGPTLKNM